MKATRFVAAAAALLSVAAATALHFVEGPSVPARDVSALTGDPDRGAYVARLAGCVACHTDGANGGAVLAGGGPISTAFGTFYGPNITPHPDDGVGDWTLAEFAAALAAGEAPDGSSYYPVFPFDHYTRMTSQDIVDLWAALQTVPAAEGVAPAHDLTFPFSLRLAAGAWRFLFLEPGAFEPDPGEEEAIARGRYLVEGPGHCGACHTPRNILGGPVMDRAYEGGLGPGNEKVPSLTRKSLTEGGWSETDIAYALKTGITPSGDVFGGSMAEVVRDGARFWTDEDRMAVASFLASR